MTKKLSLFSLVMLIVAAIDSIRNLPTVALFGSSLIFFFIASALLFLVPTALVSAELTATYPEKGGVYHWVHEAFGDKWAMLAIWMQWINTMVWYPSILLFIAGTGAYLIDPDLVNNKAYLICFMLVLFWVMTLINCKGLHFSSKINSFCGFIGTVVPMCLVISLGAIWFFSGKPLQISLEKESIFPSFSGNTSWLSLIAVMASFLGMELAGVHVNDIKNPQTTFPKAVFISSGFILFSMLFGSLAIAFILPSEEINLISGVMQVLAILFTKFNLSWLTPIISVCIVIGLAGSLINWLISPAKGLLHAAEFNFLPKLYTKKNKNGTPIVILLAQAILVSVLCLLFLLVPSINGFYWFLTVISTGLYMIMYILMFSAGLKLHHKYQNRPKSFKIPGGSCGIWIACLLGIFACSTTILVSFLPPTNIDVGSHRGYIHLIAWANLLAISPVFLFFWHKKKRKTKP